MIKTHMVSITLVLFSVQALTAKVLFDKDASSEAKKNTLSQICKKENYEDYDLNDILDTINTALIDRDNEVQNIASRAMLNMAWFQNSEIANSNPSNYSTNPDRYVLTNYFKIKPELKTHYLQLLNNLPDSVDRTEHFITIQYAKPSKEWEAYLIDRYEKEKNADKRVAQRMLELLYVHGYQSPQTLAVMKDALTQLETPALKYAETYTPPEFFPLLIQLLEAEPSTNDSSIHQIIKAIASYGALAKPYTDLMRERVSQAKGNAAKPVIQNLLEQHIEAIEALPEPEPELEPNPQSKSFNTLVVIALGLTLVLTGFFFLKPKGE
jgi:hypothetical protein